MSERAENAPTLAVSELDPFRDFFRSPVRFSRLLQGPMGAELSRETWAPAMDVAESADQYVATLEMPGASKDDVSVELHDNVLTIKGEKRDEREEQGEHRHVVERSFGSFSRSFRLPADASENVQASFRDGVLTVSVLKHEERKPRVVAIES
jgi:HSP20 family protein